MRIPSSPLRYNGREKPLETEKSASGKLSGNGLSCRIVSCISFPVQRRARNKINMADDDSFLSQGYNLFKDVLLKGFFAIFMLSAVTLITKVLSKKYQVQHFDDTNFCSSSKCLRCSRKNSTSKEILSKRLEAFSSTRGNNTGLQRLFKATICRESEDSNSPVSDQKPTVLHLHSLSCRLWYDQEEYKEELQSLILTRNYESIKSEFKQIRENLKSGWFRNTTPEGEWLVFHLFNQDEKVAKNCASCPNTVKIIESIGSFIKDCSFGNALFSTLKPGTHITPHFGPTNCRIRCHLPLFAPEGCFLCVNGEKRHWTEKKLLLFDDSFIHEASHGGVKGERTVLMIDLWHPEVLLIEKEALCFMFPSNSRL